MEYNIVHNEEESRFEALIEDKIALVDYERKGNVLRVYHTEVPKELEGKGIAAALTKTLLEYVRDNSLQVLPVCPYTVAYLERHSEYNDIVSNI